MLVLVSVLSQKADLYVLLVDPCCSFPFLLSSEVRLLQFQGKLLQCSSRYTLLQRYCLCFKCGTSLNEALSSSLLRTVFTQHYCCLWSTQHAGVFPADSWPVENTQGTVQSLCKQTKFRRLVSAL